MTELYGLPRSEEQIAADPQPGDIYRTSWGYDQTNTEFFEVVRRTPSTVQVRRIAGRMGLEEHGENPRSVYPAPGEYIADFQLGDEPKTCRLQKPRTDEYGKFGLPGWGLTISKVRRAWPYSTGGAWDTLAAGEAGH